MLTRLRTERNSPLSPTNWTHTNSTRWKLVHKYLPPALGPKAVRHYSGKMYAIQKMNFVF